MTEEFGRRKGFSLRARILGFLLAIGSVTLGVLILFIQPKLLASVDEISLRETQEELETVGDSLLPFLLQNQFAGIHENLDELRKRRPIWRQIELSDANSKRLYPLQATPAPVAPNIEAFTYRMDFRGAPLAKLTAHVDFTDDRARIRSLAQTIIWIFAAVFTAAMALVAVFLDRVVGRRALELSRAADRIAHQDYDATLPNASQDEIGDLVRSFAAMRDAVRSSEAALKESQSRLNAALSGAEMANWDWHIPNGTLLFNARWAEMLGFALEELSPRIEGWETRVFPDDMAQVRDKLERHFKDETPSYESEHRMRHKDGHWIWVQSRGKVVERNAAGTPIQMMGITFDITGRKQAEAELEQHRHHLEKLVEKRTSALMATEARASHLLASSADGLYGVDTTGRITFINPAACQMLGYRPEDAIGRSAHALFHHSRPDGTPFPIEECAGHNAVSLGHEMRSDNEVYWHADGHAVPIMYAIHPVIQDGANSGAVISFVDMSAQRAAAQAREQALIAAEHLARVRSEFLANMSHEIRTPLNGVLGFAQIGLRNYTNTEKARNAFEKILSSGNLLLGVINEILDFSKIEAGKIHIEQTEISLDDVLDQAIELVAERARAKGIALSLECTPDLPTTCLTDHLRLSQVLLNLLSNAVKFTEHGSVTVVATRRGDDLVFRVTDTGIGMTTEQLAQLFNPFQQADGSTTRRFGGTGLGLAISKRILELMGGDIRADSQAGVGSNFEFRLPYVPPIGGGQARSVGKKSNMSGFDKPLAGFSILVAEDDAVNQMVIEDNLVEEGATVVMVCNGRDAVERVLCDGGQAYDIVLMDIQMPEMDGYEATHLIRELAPDLPIIGQTAHASNEEKEKCLAGGMVGHIAKPIDAQALVALILQVVEPTS